MHRLLGLLIRASAANIAHGAAGMAAARLERRRIPKASAAIAFGMVIAGAVCASPAPASPPFDSPFPQRGAELSWEDAATALMNQRKFAEASAVLDAQLASQPRDVQAHFLTGMIAVAQGQNRQAIRIFRAILMDHPKAARVRLELARAFYLDKDYGNAMRQFQFGLAGNPPPTVASNIKRYLAVLRDAKSVSYNFALAVAPDTNLNTGSSSREISLFGLPFDLSDDARRRSGIGIAVEAGGEWAPRIGRDKRLRLGANVQRREYAGADFDDMIVTAYAGPRVAAGNLDVSVLATAYRRWFGSSLYNQAKGGRIEATFYVNGSTAVSGALNAQWLRHPAEAARNGRIVTLGGSVFRALTSSSAVTLKGSVARQTARASAYSNCSTFIAAGYFRELPLGFSAYLEPSFSIARYDTALFGFSRKRADTTQSLLVTLLNRHLVLSRFTPRISYTFTRQRSTVPLYQFNRSRLEIGLTTVF